MMADNMKRSEKATNLESNKILSNPADISTPNRFDRKACHFLLSPFYL